MATTLVNLTPHALNIHTDEGVLRIPPSGVVARVSSEIRDEGGIEVLIDNVVKKVGLSSSTFGEVVGLREPTEGTTFVVSGMVLSALGGARDDVMAPGELVRGSDGVPIGCMGLRR